MKPWLLIAAGLILAFGDNVLPESVTIPVPSWSWVQTTAKADRAVYVYEKDSTAIPSAVMGGINRLNREGGIVATLLEADTVDGSGEVPPSYRAPLAAAEAAGLPCLVVMAGDKVVRTVKAPATADQVWEAAR